MDSALDIIQWTSMILIIIFVILLIIVLWIWFQNPYEIIEWWNNRIKAECDKQDADSMNGIPSYHDAWDCPNKTATQLHQMIFMHHDDILAEVMETIKDYKGLPMNELDLIQRQWLRGEDRWRPIWVRFMGSWAGSAERLPTLKNIVSMFPEVNILHVSVFYPGTTLIEHRGPSRSVHRYHYGLKIPDGDVSLKIAGYDVKWKEHEGFIWDDTLPHSAWNHTSEPRIVIFADINRELSSINAIGSRLIYFLLQNTQHVTQIKERLLHEGIRID